MIIRFNNTMFFRFFSPEAKSFPNKTYTEMISALGEEKNKDILDSIRYAKRIQQSLLPTEKYFARKLMGLNKQS